MSSSAGNPTPSSSHPPSSVPPSESSDDKPSKEKLKVTIQPNGSIVGVNSKAWGTRTEDFVRAYIPISYKDYREIPDNFKDDV